MPNYLPGQCRLSFKPYKNLRSYLNTAPTATATPPHTHTIDVYTIMITFFCAHDNLHDYYTLRREYPVAGNRYIRLVFISEVNFTPISVRNINRRRWLHNSSTLRLPGLPGHIWWRHNANCVVLAGLCVQGRSNVWVNESCIGCRVKWYLVILEAIRQWLSPVAPSLIKKYIAESPHPWQKCYSR